MSTNLLPIIQASAVNTVESLQICDVKFGVVISTSPLKVKVTNQFILPDSLLIVPQHLTTHTINCSFKSSDGEQSTQPVTFYNALKTGDMVALLRKQGGQSYYILDRI